MVLELHDDQLDAVAPFSVVCSGDLVIERIGPSLRKALGRDLAGEQLADAFTIERPRGVDTPAEVRARAGMAFLLRSLDHDLSLRCQPLLSPTGDRIVFFGSLALASESDMSRLGVGYADFAASDPTPDLLILKRTQERSLQDLATLNTELERSGSQLRAANAALTDAERRYRTLVEQQPLVTYIDELGEDVTSLFMSDNVLELTGYPATLWTTEPNFFFQVLHPDDRDRIRAAHVASERAEAPFRAEFRLITADGRVVWVQAEDKPVLDEQGRPLYRLGYLLDITERRHAEEGLRDTGTRLTTLIGSLQAGILLEDEHRRVVLTNEAFCSIFGIPVAPDQLVGADCRAAAEQAKALAADPDRFIARIDEILEEREAVREEVVEFGDGRVFERDYVPIVVGGVYRGHLWGYRDVTPRIDAQRAIEEAHDRAVEASRVKSEFLATVSHEIRTPMHGVLGTIDLLERTSLDAEQQELVSIVRSSAGALLAVINDILDLQKAELGHVELLSEPLDLAGLAGSVTDVVRPGADAKGVELVTTVDETLPRDLLGDPVRIRQILLNLVGNAVKFTDHGRVTVSVGLDSVSDEAATVRLVIADTGIGIPLEEQEHIFEPFAQADSSSTRRHEGTGLGLTITKQLVTLMNGGIAIESVPGEGTSVTATVSLQRGSGDLDAERRVVARDPAVELSGTVLLAEDSPVNRELAMRQLSRLGVTARAVDTGAAAVAAIERGHYDLVLMDLRMPEMDGLEATRAIRALEAAAADARRLPIVAMTANAMPDDRAVCLEAGMDDYVTKPLLLDDLADVLGRWLPDLSPAQPAAEPAPLPEQTAPTAADDDADEARLIVETLDRLAAELGSPEAVRRVAELWLSELPGRVDGLRAAAAARDSEQLRTGAHTIKSTSSLVGAVAAGALAADIERLAAEGAALEPARVEALARATERAAAVVVAWCDDAEPPEADLRH